MKIATERISPWNPVEDQDLFAALRHSMEEHGWRGRPLLVYQQMGSWRAVTGSHRYAAAKAAKIAKIPCIILPDSRLPDGGTLWSALDAADNSGPVFHAIYEAKLDDLVLGLMALDTMQSQDYVAEQYENFAVLGAWVRERLDADEDSWSLPPPERLVAS